MTFLGFLPVWCLGRRQARLAADRIAAGRRSYRMIAVSDRVISSMSLAGIHLHRGKALVQMDSGSELAARLCGLDPVGYGWNDLLWVFPSLVPWLKKARLAPIESRRGRRSYGMIAVFRPRHFQHVVSGNPPCIVVRTLF